MQEYKYPSFSDEYKKISDVTLRIANQITNTANKFIKKQVNSDDVTILFCNIIKAINFWTGSTYVGSKKDSAIENAFQKFYNALYAFVLKFREMNEPVFQECANLILYRGTVYRYLGNSDPVNHNGRIEPIYNDIYVSWSKEPNNNSLESKLYGTMTWMSAEIKEPYYGIDLEGLGKAIELLFDTECVLSRGNEREVVFPTIKECITEVKYIECNYEEDEIDDQT